MAPDITISEDAEVLYASHGRPFVMTQAAFVELATPHVERAEKVKVLRDRWDREGGACPYRRPGSSEGGFARVAGSVLATTDGVSRRPLPAFRRAPTAKQVGRQP
jgi:hypothetical protein